MCYNIKTIYFNNPLFNEIDATYIIHLEGNGRYDHIEEQLKTYHPTKIVHILFNKGYKKCNKNNIDSPAKDLIDANKYICEHAKRYDTILILEDDFIFNEMEKVDIDNIESFIKTNTSYIYKLGCIPFIQIPYNSYTYTGFSAGSHAVIYSKDIRNTLNKDNMDDWDMNLAKHINYMYYIPLCYQLFPETDNRQSWGKHNIMWYITGKIFIQLFNLLQLDHQLEPGYSIMYTFSKISPIIITLILIKLYFHIVYGKNKA